MRSCGWLRVGDPARHVQDGQPILGHPGGQILHLHARSTSLPEPAGKNRAGRAHRKNRRSPKRAFHRYPRKGPKPAHHIHKHQQSQPTKHNHPASDPPAITKPPSATHPKCTNQRRQQSRPDKPQSNQIQEMNLECNLRDFECSQPS